LSIPSDPYRPPAAGDWSRPPPSFASQAYQNDDYQAPQPYPGWDDTVTDDELTYYGYGDAPPYQATPYQTTPYQALYPDEPYASPPPEQLHYPQPQYSSETQYTEPRYDEPKYDQGPYDQARYGQEQYDQPEFAQAAYAQAPYQSRYPAGPADPATPADSASTSSSANTRPGKRKGSGKPKKKGKVRRMTVGILVLVVIAAGFLLRGTVRNLVQHSDSSPAAASAAALPAPSASHTARKPLAVPVFAVGDCMDLTGAAELIDTKVDCTATTANYKILAMINDVSGTLAIDSPKCYSVSGDDMEFETTGADNHPALYCLASTIDRHSARRAQQGDCIDSSSTGDASYLVDCSDSAANYMVVARISGTDETSKCDIYAGATGSLTISAPPEVLLCLKTKAK
jgi:hypothetical protein